MTTDGQLSVLFSPRPAGVARELLAQAERARKAGARRERVLERRHAVHVAMTGAIDTSDRPAAEVDRLLGDLNDWMDVQDDAAFAGERPIGAILWTACQALDLPVDLTVWEHEDWADQEIVQRPEGSPYRAHRVTAGRRGSRGLTPTLPTASPTANPVRGHPPLPSPRPSVARAGPDAPFPRREPARSRRVRPRVCAATRLRPG